MLFCFLRLLITSVLGFVILAFGVFVMLSTDFIMLPQDAAVAVISNKYKKEYGKIKITLDVILTTIATASSFVIFSRIIHVGVGTILAAIFVGKIISLLQKSAGINRFISWLLVIKGKMVFIKWTNFCQYARIT